MSVSLSCYGQHAREYIFLGAPILAIACNCVRVSLVFLLRALFYSLCLAFSISVTMVASPIQFQLLTPLQDLERPTTHAWL